MKKENYWSSFYKSVNRNILVEEKRKPNTVKITTSKINQKPKINYSQQNKQKIDFYDARESNNL